MLYTNGLVTSPWHYWKVAKSLEGALEEDTEIFSPATVWWAALLCRVTPRPNRLFSLAWVQNNRAKWPWTATSETIDLNQSFLVPVGHLGYFVHRNWQLPNKWCSFCCLHWPWPSRKQNSIIAGTTCPNPLLSAERMVFYKAVFDQIFLIHTQSSSIHPAIYVTSVQCSV